MEKKSAVELIKELLEVYLDQNVFAYEIKQVASSCDDGGGSLYVQWVYDKPEDTTEKEDE